MAVSLAILQTNIHVRSTSLPSNTHPLISSVKDQLQRLRASKEASSYSSLSLCTKLDGLKNLYECVNDMLQLPLMQQGLSPETNMEMLDESLRLVDICSSAGDIYSQMKVRLRDLESALRRRRGAADSGTLNEAEEYMTSRKKLIKETLKILKNLKKMEKNTTASNQDSAVSLLREVETVSLAVFKSVLSFVIQSESKPKPWSLVLKSFRSKRVSSDEGKESEMENLDVELLGLKQKKSSQGVQNVLKRIETIESSIQGMEDSLECVYRHLLKTRVSLLNGSNI